MSFDGVVYCMRRALLAKCEHAHLFPSHLLYKFSLPSSAFSLCVISPSRTLFYNFNPRSFSSVLLSCPHLFEIFDDKHVCVHEAINAVLNVGLLGPVQLAAPETTGNRLLETHVC